MDLVCCTAVEINEFVDDHMIVHPMFTMYSDDCCAAAPRHSSIISRQRFVYQDPNTSSGAADCSVVSREDPFEARENAKVLSPDIDEDDDSPMHTLTLELIESLQKHLPVAKRGESFWLRYSLIRDGASLDVLLRNVQDSDYTVMVVETLDGEVFGAFTAEPWRVTHGYYGTGESFLWRLISDSKESPFIDPALQPAEVEIFKFAFHDWCVQLCNHDRIAIGGGGERVESHGTGYGLSFERDLLTGTSSPCSTFNSPALSKIHPNGSSFEVANLEIWAMTPCHSFDEAEKLSLDRRLRMLHREDSF